VGGLTESSAFIFIPLSTIPLLVKLIQALQPIQDAAIEASGKDPELIDKFYDWGDLVTALAKEGEIPENEAGDDYLVPAELVEEWLAGQELVVTTTDKQLPAPESEETRRIVDALEVQAKDFSYRCRHDSTSMLDANRAQYQAFADLHYRWDHYRQHGRFPRED
jgi:hypothetical protein